MAKFYPPNLMCEKAVADVLGVSESWLQKGRVYGYGPSFIRLRNGKGGIRYLESSVVAWIEKNTVETGRVV